MRVDRVCTSSDAAHRSGSQWVDVFVDDERVQESDRAAQAIAHRWVDPTGEVARNRLREQPMDLARRPLMAVMASRAARSVLLVGIVWTRLGSPAAQGGAWVVRSYGVVPRGQVSEDLRC